MHSANRSNFSFLLELLKKNYTMENKKKTAAVLLALSEFVHRKILEMNSVITETIRKAAIMRSIGKISLNGITQ